MCACFCRTHVQHIRDRIKGDSKFRMILFEKIIHDAIKWKNSLLVVLNVLIERVMFSIEKYDIREILVECYNVSLEFNTIEKAIRNDISI